MAATRTPGITINADGNYFERDDDQPQPGGRARRAQPCRTFLP
jgi:hypothetical protein